MIKFLPYSLLCPQEIENWLNEMSKNGYHLKSLNRTFAVFTEGYYEDIKYLVQFHTEPLLDKPNRDGETAKGSENGWELMQENERLFNIDIFEEPVYFSVYRSTADKPINDISDDESIKESLAAAAIKIYKKLSFLSSATCSIGSGIIGFAFKVSYGTYHLDHFFLRLLRGTSAIIFFLILNYRMFRVNKFRKYYLGKKPIPEKPIKRPSFLSLGIIIVLTLLIILIDPEKLSTPQDNVYLGNVDNLVTLEGIEGEHSDNLPDHLLDDYYYGYRNFAPLMPLHYDISERVDNDKTVYADIEYTRTCLSSRLNKQCLVWPRFYVDEEIVTISSTYFDDIRYVKLEDHNKKTENGFYYYFLFHNKNELIEIAYRGERTPEEVIANVEKLFIDE